MEKSFSILNNVDKKMETALFDGGGSAYPKLGQSLSYCIASSASNCHPDIIETKILFDNLDTFTREPRWVARSVGLNKHSAGVNIFFIINTHPSNEVNLFKYKSGYHALYQAIIFPEFHYFTYTI